jgi:hypothetical protein
MSAAKPNVAEAKAQREAENAAKKAEREALMAAKKTAAAEAVRTCKNCIFKSFYVRFF